MVKNEKIDSKDQKVEKSSKKINKSSYSKKKENKKKYFEWNCLRAVNFQQHYYLNS